MAGGGKMTPRQKMINMMYIVLMAMLALNVSVEVLDAFKSVNKTLEESADQSAKKSKAALVDLENKSQNNKARYGTKYEEAKAVKTMSDDLFNKLEGYKVDLLKKTGAIELDKEEINSPDFDAGTLESTDAAAEYFFMGGVVTEKGKEFVGAMDAFREKALIAAGSNAGLKANIESNFNTDPVKRKEGGKSPWIINKFEHYPVGAAIAFISQIQASLRITEADLFAALSGAATENVTLNATKTEAINLATATSIVQGGKYKSEIVLAAMDETIEPEIVIFKVDGNGKKVGQEIPLKVVDGVGIVDLPANSIGNHKYKSIIRYKTDDGEPKEVEMNDPFEFDVTKPSAVVAADKMNVVYVGVDNPISVSVPGVNPDKVQLTGSGIRRAGAGKYIVKPNSVGNGKISFGVVAEMPDGSTKSFPKKVFRIKDIPAPQVSLKGLTGDSDLAQRIVTRGVQVKLEDFDFPVSLVVTSFEVKVEGKAPVKVSGSKFDSKSSKLIKGSKNKDMIIRNIKYKMVGGAKIKPKKVGSLSVRIK